MLPKLIVILGPTAAGKTELAFSLAKKYNAEIVAADSRQIYQEISIGVNKDKGRWQKDENDLAYYVSRGLRIHCLDFLPPEKSFTVLEYQQLAIKTINDIIERKKNPFLVGGTGFYIDAVVNNWRLRPKSFDQELRKKLIAKPNIVLLGELKKIDPVKAKLIDQHNKIRLIRALEIYYLTGETMALAPEKGAVLYEVLKIGVDKDRVDLHQKINDRVDRMFAAGLVVEVRGLKEKYKSDLPIFKSIGYRQLAEYLDGQISLEKARELIKRDTRRYARRQLTWWRRDKEIKWCADFETADKLVKNFLLAKFD